MTGEKLWAALGGVRDGYVTEAMEYQKGRRNWVRWAALAACLCLVVGSVLAWRWSRPGGVVGCTELPPRLPASEDPKDVVGVERIKMTPEDPGPLGAFLPTRLPEGYFLQYAVFFRTTMRDGTEYHMLGTGYSQEETGIPLSVQVFDYLPRDIDLNGTELRTREEAKAYLAGQTEKGLSVAVSAGNDKYVYITVHQLTPAQLIDLIDAIP